jgi:hypothetical protein
MEQILGSSSEFLLHCGLRIFICNEFPGDSDATDLGCDHTPRAIALKDILK